MLSIELNTLIVWMVFYATFNSISVLSQQQLTLFMSGVSPIPGWSVLPKNTPMKKPRGPQGYESNTTTEPCRTPTFNSNFLVWKKAKEPNKKRLIDWMVSYPTLNIISVTSQRQLSLVMSFLGFNSSRLGLWSTQYLAQGHYYENPKQ